MAANFASCLKRGVLQKISASGISGPGFGDGSAAALRGLQILIYAAACASPEPLRVIRKVLPNRIAPGPAPIETPQCSFPSNPNACD